jgi:ammonium transporter, Amt family
MTGNVDLGSFYFSYACAAAAVTIVAGTLAERSQNAAHCAYSAFMVMWVYPVIAHSFWSVNGFLSPSLKNPFLGVGAIDFAGSGVIHLSGGTTALIAAFILGPRTGRFYNNRGEILANPKDIPGHSISLQVLGFFILWFGCKYNLV